MLRKRTSYVKDGVEENDVFASCAFGEWEGEREVSLAPSPMDGLAGLL